MKLDYQNGLATIRATNIKETQALLIFMASTMDSQLNDIAGKISAYSEVVSRPQKGIEFPNKNTWKGKHKVTCGQCGWKGKNISYHVRRIHTSGLVGPQERRLEVVNAVREFHQKFGRFPHKGDCKYGNFTRYDYDAMFSLGGRMGIFMEAVPGTLSFPKHTRMA